MKKYAETDIRYMRAALALADRGLGITTPNPAVGCVIIREGKIVGRGFTQKGGRPHGEFMALAQAGALAKGATVYTTLEPCAHDSSRGPACSNMLISAGVSRVVMAITDPDPRTAGKGRARLEAAGMQVTTGVCADAAHYQLRAFQLRLAKARPWVTLKMAVTLDGFIAQTDGTSQWISGPDSRAHVHLIRARQDAIIIGRGTDEKDAPQLTVRLAGLQSRSPQPIIFSTQTAESGAARPVAAKVMTAPDLGVFLAGLAAEGMLHVLVEGGATTAGRFLDADLIDEIHLYRAPVLLGQGRQMSDMQSTRQLSQTHGRWCVHETRSLGADQLTVYLRTRET
jgi:diaminohydroxyphosphoribosylaminopyrimidine deaminase / 5-amino-6-(5-phosphoribosylamino)uracil reductase